MFETDGIECRTNVNLFLRYPNPFVARPLPSFLHETANSCRGYMRNKIILEIISAFVDVPTEIILPKIISEVYCSS